MKKSIWYALFEMHYLKRSTDYFGSLGDMKEQILFEGVRAKSVQNGEIMLSFIELDAGVVVPAHEHRYAQMGMILNGTLEMQIGVESKTLKNGDFFKIPPNIPHGAKSYEENVKLIECYFPLDATLLKRVA